MYKKPMVVDLINRFGKDRVLRALTKRRFTNARRVEERKTGQKHMGFSGGGAAGTNGSSKLYHSKNFPKPLGEVVREIELEKKEKLFKFKKPKKK